MGGWPVVPWHERAPACSHKVRFVFPNKHSEKLSVHTYVLTDDKSVTARSAYEYRPFTAVTPTEMNERRHFRLGAEDVYNLSSTAKLLRVYFLFFSGADCTNGGFFSCILNLMTVIPAVSINRVVYENTKSGLRLSEHFRVLNVFWLV